MAFSWIKNVRVISEGPDAFYNFRLPPARLRVGEPVHVSGTVHDGGGRPTVWTEVSVDFLPGDVPAAWAGDAAACSASRSRSARRG